MAGWGKYAAGALLVAITAHIAAVHAAPRLLMQVAIERLSAAGFNRWQIADRVTPASRQIVRPSPDFAYSACVFDLNEGPVILTAAPWNSYWSLSLYAANSDNFFVIDDREAQYGAEITLVQRGRPHPEGASQVVESPSRRGVALIRRLAPSPDTYAAAAEVARGDMCTSVARIAG